MKSRHSLIIPYFVLILFVAAAAHAAPESSAFSIGLAPAVQIPFSFSGDTLPYTMGGLVSLNAQYDFGQDAGFLIRGGLNYYYNPYTSGNSLSLFALYAGAGYQFGLFSIFHVGAFVGGGYNYGFQNATFEMGGSLYGEAGLGLDIVLIPELSLSVGASYRLYAGLLRTSAGDYAPLNAAGAYVGVSYFLSGLDARREQIQGTKPVDIELLKGYKTAAPGKGISIETVSLAPVFPVFRKYYDDHPVGTIVIKNNEKTAIDGVSVSINIKDYMNDPKSSPIGRLEGGESKEVPFFALFNEHVLDTTEASKTSAVIWVDYRMADANYRAELTDSIRLLNRNAMTWEDNRRAAAFVTSKDPAVLSFAKNVIGIIRDVKVRGINDKLLSGFALHEALGLYGLAYVVDPQSSYAEQSKKTDADFLQFPRETLEYKAGDCDDLSILNAALLESIGIESAFITVPGHIFMAFSLGLTQEEARLAFSSTDDLIFMEGKTWIPVEITNIQNGFLAAWKEGAREWRTSSTAGEAGFYPVREAWSIFEAVGLPGKGLEPVMPAADKVLALFQQETAKFVDEELDSQLTRFQALNKLVQSTPDAQNKLGVIYAKFGKYDQAVEQFKKATEKQEYAPALINLANVSYLQTKWSDARGYFERASKLDPLNPRIILGVARTAYEQGDAATVKKQYDYVKKLDPDLASKFAYLDASSSSTTRAADAQAAKENVIWEDTQ